jgi:small subunit ribosomal protein S16
MVKIRLTRAGSTGRPYYQVTVIDERKRRDGRPLAYLGNYDPRPNPEQINIDVEAAEAWIAKGARPSSTVQSLMRRLRQRGAAAAGGAA